jgi:hypothetical protein
VSGGKGGRLFIHRERNILISPVVHMLDGFDVVKYQTLDSNAAILIKATA